MASVRTLRDDFGREVDLMVSSRHTLQGIVEAGLRRQLWREAADHHEELEAVRRGEAVASLRCGFLSKKATARLAACGSSARNALVGCLWPVARRARATPPLASSARCPWGCDEAATVRHLAWRCPALDGPRRQQTADGT